MQRMKQIQHCEQTCLSEALWKMSEGQPRKGFPSHERWLIYVDLHSAIGHLISGWVLLPMALLRWRSSSWCLVWCFIRHPMILRSSDFRLERAGLIQDLGWTWLKVSGWKNIERTHEEDNLSKNSQAFIGVIAKRTQFRFRWRLGAICFQQVFDWSETTFYYKLSKKQLQMRAAGDPGPSSGFHGLPKETCSTWSHVKSQWWAKRTAKPTCKSFS